MIESICFEGVRTLSTSEGNVITAFGIISYLLLSIVVISKIILSVTEDENDRRSRWLTRYSNAFSERSIDGSRAWILFCAIVAITLVVQFWALFRFRQLQSAMVEAVGESFPDGQWTFGQIVAIAVFIPVLAEVVFLWKRRSLYHR